MRWLLKNARFLMAVVGNLTKLLGGINEEILVSFAVTGADYGL
jgi:hypothetical protein